MSQPSSGSKRISSVGQDTSSGAKVASVQSQASSDRVRGSIGGGGGGGELGLVVDGAVSGISGSASSISTSKNNASSSSPSSSVTGTGPKVSHADLVSFAKICKTTRSSSGSGPSSTTSNTQRLSSIDILNENKQRQLQFKQQESFKQHVEQRQQLIQQQLLHQRDRKNSQPSTATIVTKGSLATSKTSGNVGRHRGRSNSSSSSNEDNNSESTNLGVTYQVNTNVPDYMASAVAKSHTVTVDGSTKTNLNPFDEEARKTQIRKQQEEPSQVSGKSGFLAALMDEASFDAGLGVPKRTQQMDEDDERLANQREQQRLEQTRYAKVGADGGSRFNYDDDPGKRPFYQKDLSSLLQDLRASRKLVILIVAIALLLDNMLLTSVVPIIPAYLYKLRIENQWANANGSATSRSISSSTKAGKFGLPSSGGGQMGNEDELADIETDDELEWRINQSIAAARDRYSGSVFHPRIISPGSKFNINDAGNEEEIDERYNDNDDNGDDGGGEDNNQVYEERIASSKIRSNDDDSDDSRMRQSSKSMRVQVKQQSGDQMISKSNERKSGAGLKSSKANENNGDDSYGDDEMAVESPAWNQNKPAGKRQPESSRRNQKVADGQPSPNGGTDDGDDDEDSSTMSAARWNRLRSSLISALEKNGNDTGSIGGICLNLVLGSDSDYGDGTDGSTDIDRQRGTKSKSRDSDSSKRGMDGGRAKLNRIVRDVTTKTRMTIRPRGRINNTSNAQQMPSKKKSKFGSKGMTKKDMEMMPISHQDIVDESFEVGVMFASKPIVQAFANPFIGTLTNRVGFTIPMFTGFVIMFLSTLVFAFGSSYSTLFIARAIQGVGSACTSVAGMSMLADRFPDDAERGNAMAFALGGLAMGVVIGPPFGGFMYEFVGKSSPFIVLSILALFDGFLQLMVLQPRVTKSQEEGASLLTLIKDPYILVAAGAITFANTGIAILEPALPLWMMDKMQATNWEQGVAFLPAALSYMLGTNLFGNLGHKIGRWRSTMIGLVVIGCSLLLIPFAMRVEHLIIPNGAIGFAMGMVDSTMMPMLGYLVDIRHTSVYGSVYAIGDVAFCASFAFGPALSGTLVELIGFEGLIITTAVICFSFAPLLVLLRDPPPRQADESQLQEQAALRYVNYSHLDSPDEEAQSMSASRQQQPAKIYAR